MLQWGAAGLTQPTGAASTTSRDCISPQAPHINMSEINAVCMDFIANAKVVFGDRSTFFIDR
jgi:hypothetical protein